MGPRRSGVETVPRVGLPRAESLVSSWLGRTLQTVTRSTNTVLEVDARDVLVATARSRKGKRVPINMVQSALDQLEAEGYVEVSTDAIGFRSAFCGAVLLTLPGVVPRGGSPPLVGWRPKRKTAVPSREDLGAIQPWWSDRPHEFFWTEITDRLDVGTDLHCPQRDTGLRANPGFSTIFYVRDGDVVVHYDRNTQAIIAWSIARGPVEEAPTLWVSHRGAVRRRVGSEPREQPGWWLDLEGPFMIEPVTLADLRAHGPPVLHAIEQTAPPKRPAYAPFFGYGIDDELRPTQFYLTKLPRAVVDILSLDDAIERVTADPDDAPQVGAEWREPWVSESDDSVRQIEVDVEVIERGLRGHVETERALGAALHTVEIAPLAPSGPDPKFDLAWIHRDTFFVAEVKSITDRNEERQLRLGLGQVMRYRSQLRAALKLPVVAVLVPERSPRDETWASACAEADVVLLPGDALPKGLHALLSRDSP